MLWRGMLLDCRLLGGLGWFCLFRCGRLGLGWGIGGGGFRRSLGLGLGNSVVPIGLGRVFGLYPCNHQ